MSWRPDRSDAHLTPEEEERREAEARDYFDGIAPKRHSKPSRSDYSSVYADALPPSRRDDSIPEHHKFQHLEANSGQKLVCEGSEVVEEYVQTEYYDDLNCVDKQHHTVHINMFFILVQASSRWRNPMAAPSKLRLTLMHPTAMFPAGAIRQQMSGYHLLIRWFQRRKNLTGVMCD